MGGDGAACCRVFQCLLRLCSLRAVSQERRECCSCNCTPNIDTPSVRCCKWTTRVKLEAAMEKKDLLPVTLW
ncbi:hypothetical protein E2C01_075886 [Portunus trituberculatus]|uniref:Secreted protein n=1 Tax=Portunus trituberculatus TaxID=210409 RepID=A0A5B7IHI4_PORTR|nr:hypothetical protein [Portunus trituberculatus]